LTKWKELLKKARSAYRKNPPEAVRQGLTDKNGVPLDPRTIIKGKPNPRYKKPMMRTPPFDISDMKCPSCHNDMSRVSTVSTYRIRAYCSRCDAVIWMTTSSFDDFIKKRAKKRYLKKLEEERMNPSRRDNNLGKNKWGY